MQIIKEKVPALEQVKKDYEAIKNSKQKDPKALTTVAKGFCANKAFDLAFECIQTVRDQKDRNLLIADLVEAHLLPAKEFTTAKKFAKFLVDHELQPLLMVRIALAEGKKSEAEAVANSLDSPLTRNFAFIQIIETYLADNKKVEAKKLCDQILENTKSIYDAKTRSYVLRDIAIDLYFANHEKELAKQAAELIPDSTLKEQTLKKIGV